MKKLMKKLLLTLSLTFLASNTSLAMRGPNLVDLLAKATRAVDRARLYVEIDAERAFEIQISATVLYKDQRYYRIGSIRLLLNKKTCKIERVIISHPYDPTPTTRVGETVTATTIYYYPSPLKKMMQEAGYSEEQQAEELRKLMRSGKFRLVSSFKLSELVEKIMSMPNVKNKIPTEECKQRAAKKAYVKRLKELEEEKLELFRELDIM